MQDFKKNSKKETFDFGVIATRSRERYEICDKLFKNNKVKNLFLEKFLFNDYHHYKLFNKLHKKYKIKTYVNIWSKIFLKRVSLKQTNAKILIKVILPKKKILTNLIHFYEIFRILTKEEFKIDLSEFRLNNLNKFYHEGDGIIKFVSKNKSKMIIKTKKIKNSVFINYRSNKRRMRIVIDKGFIKIYQHSKAKIKKFPLASLETYKFFQNLIEKKRKKKQINFPKYSTIEKGSLKILNCLNKKFNKKINIS